MNCGSYTRLVGLFLLRLSTREDELVLDQQIKKERKREMSESHLLYTLTPKISIIGRAEECWR